jgi:hypothetical protein
MKALPHTIHRRVPAPREVVMRLPASSIPFFLDRGKAGAGDSRCGARRVCVFSLKEIS